MPDIAAELQALKASSIVSSQATTPIKTRKVRSLPTEADKELAALQASYDDFVENSQMLEEELELEIAQTISSLSKVTIENEELKVVLEDRHSQLTRVEHELAQQSSRCAQEAQLRVTAELSQDEAENQARNAQGALEASVKECDVLHEKLAYAEAELEEFRMTVDIEREESQIKVEDLEHELEKALTRAHQAETKLTATPQLHWDNNHNHNSVLVTPIKAGYEVSEAGSVTTASCMDDCITEAESFDYVVKSSDEDGRSHHSNANDMNVSVVNNSKQLNSTSKRIKRKRGISSRVRKLGKKHFTAQATSWFRKGKQSPQSSTETEKTDPVVSD